MERAITDVLSLLVDLEASGREYLIASLDHSQRIDDATRDRERAKALDEPEDGAVQNAWIASLMRLGSAQTDFTRCLNRTRAAVNLELTPAPAPNETEGEGNPSP